MEIGEVLVPKPRTMVLLWVHFALSLTIKESEVEEAMCKIYCRKVPVKSANATNQKCLETSRSH